MATQAEIIANIQKGIQEAQRLADLAKKQAASDVAAGKAQTFVPGTTTVAPSPSPTSSPPPAPLPPTPTRATTPSGAVVNPATGALISPPPAPPPVVSSSATVRAELTKRGVVDTDAFKLPTPKSFEQFKATVSPGVTKPPSPKFRDVYSQLRQEQGVTALEDEDVGLETEKEEVEAAFREFKAKESRGMAPKGFISGRISEEEQNLKDRIDFVERRQRTIQLKLKNKGAFISDYMKFTEKDFDAARDDYEFEFNKNLQTQTAYQNYKNSEEARVNRIRDDARATLTTVNNLISNSGKDFSAFIAENPGYAKYVNELELMSGIPLGTFEAFAQSKPKANLLATVQGETETGEKSISLIYANPDGTPGVVKTVSLPGVTGRGTKDFTETQIQQGAEAAGMTESAFRKLDPERQRFYVFGLGKELHGGRMDPTKLELIKQNIQTKIEEGKLTRKEAEAQIDTLPSVADKLELLLFLDTFTKPK